MLQSQNGMVASEATYDYSTNRDNALSVLGVAAHYILDCVDLAIQQLSPDSTTGLKSFTTASLFNVVSDVTRFPYPYPNTPLFDWAEVERAGDPPYVIEEFVEMHFAILVWNFLLRSDRTWVYSNIPERSGFELYEMRYVEAARSSIESDGNHPPNGVAIKSKQHLEDEERRKRATPIIRELGAFYSPSDDLPRNRCPSCDSFIEIQRQDGASAYSSCDCGKCNEYLGKLFAPEMR
jgi:hypothetical protein